MKLKFLLSSFLSLIVLVSCQTESNDIFYPENSLSKADIEKIVALGFDTLNVKYLVVKSSYLVEGDIVISKPLLESATSQNTQLKSRVVNYPGGMQGAASPELVCDIKVYFDNINSSVKKRACHKAISNFNSLGTFIKMRQTTLASEANITIVEDYFDPSITRGWAGCADLGWETRLGPKIWLHPLMVATEADYTYWTGVIMHEIGHTLGFMHNHTTINTEDRTYSSVVPTTLDFDNTSIMSYARNRQSDKFSVDDIKGFKYYYTKIPIFNIYKPNSDGMIMGYICPTKTANTIPVYQFTNIVTGEKMLQSSEIYIIKDWVLDSCLGYVFANSNSQVIIPLYAYSLANNQLRVHTHVYHSTSPNENFRISEFHKLREPIFYIYSEERFIIIPPRRTPFTSEPVPVKKK